MQESPGWRPDIGKQLAITLINSVTRKRNCCLGGAVGKGRARPVNHHDRHHGGNVSPILPFVERGEIVSSHDPYEIHPAVVLADQAQGFLGIVQVITRFKRGNLDAPVLNQVAAGPDALRQWRQFRMILERISRCYQPPYLIQLAAHQCRLADMQVPVVGRIE